MDAGPRIDSYAWAGGREAMLRWGPEDGPVVVLALPLFEEANRTRAFGCAILRALADRGVGGVLPELPGQGESLVPTEATILADLRAAFAVAGAGGYAVAIRSGALLPGDELVAGRWLLAPQSGAELVRELARVSGTALDGERVTVAGNAVSRSLLKELAPTSFHPGEGPVGSHVRVVRLSSDHRAADRHIDGAPIWRRAEPGSDPVLAQALADDISAWIATCAG